MGNWQMINFAIPHKSFAFSFKALIEVKHTNGEEVVQGQAIPYAVALSPRSKDQFPCALH